MSTFAERMRARRASADPATEPPVDVALEVSAASPDVVPEVVAPSAAPDRPTLDAYWTFETYQLAVGSVGRVVADHLTDLYSVWFQASERGDAEATTLAESRFWDARKNSARLAQTLPTPEAKNYPMEGGATKRPLNAWPWPPLSKREQLDPAADFKASGTAYPEPLRSLLRAIAGAWTHGHVEFKRKGQDGKDETIKRGPESQRQEYSRLVAWWAFDAAAITPEWVAAEQARYQTGARA